MPTSIDGLLKGYGAEESEFTFTLPGGEEIKGKTLASASEIAQIQKHASTVVKAIGKGLIPPEWAPYLPASPEVLRTCVFVEALCIEPKFTFVDALRMAKECGGLIFTLGNALSQHIKGIAIEKELEEIEEAKNA